MTLPTLGSIFLLDSGFLYPHFGQTSVSEASFPLLDFLGSRREPHFGQNSIISYSVFVLFSLCAVSFKLFYVSENRMLLGAYSGCYEMRYAEGFRDVASGGG